MEKDNEKKLYAKKFTYTKDTSGKKHLSARLTAWIKWTIWEYEEGKRDKNKCKKVATEKSTNYCKIVADCLFDSIYPKYSKEDKDFWKEVGIKPYIWDKDMFEKWRDNLIDKPDDRVIKCHYCNCSPDTLGQYYELLKSDRWTRGQSFEIDRKHVRMKTYLKTPLEKDSYINWVKPIIEDALAKCSSDKKIKDSTLIPLLEEALNDNCKDHDKSNYLYLPAPYNDTNCVFACYWCNNAKTDAFTEKEFKPIGDVIGAKIKEEPA